MSKLRVQAFSLSFDGYGAGMNQSLENPLGEGGMAVHEWLFPTRTFKTMVGESAGETGVDESFAARSTENIGAWILGRNMFTPSRGAWPNDEWKGWWGDNPPYHCDVFVLTHHKRDPMPMEGGTTFHFVTDGIHTALERAKASAAGKDVRLGGGASATRQYLQAGLVDEMHFAVTPTVLGSGENLLAGIDLRALGFHTDYIAGECAAHFVLKRQA